MRLVFLHNHFLAFIHLSTDTEIRCIPPLIENREGEEGKVDEEVTVAQG